MHKISRYFIHVFLVSALFLTACGSQTEFDGVLFFRTIDGTDNNLSHSLWGGAGNRLQRLAPPAYEDAIAEPAGAGRPDPRTVSNAVFSQTASIPNNRGLSNMVWQWGQFLAHDIDLTPEDKPSDTSAGQPLFIPVPTGDPFFDPENTGTVLIPFFRSIFDPVTGTSPENPRQQVNQITAWIDGSNVYGSDETRAAWLRTMVGGRLKTSAGDLMPFNDGTIANDPDMSPDLFVGGDVRANEQVGLTVMHTLFLREHNRLADEIAAEHPSWSDEQIYQLARKIVGAYMEIITFREFLPALMGPYAPPPEDPGYAEELDPSIFNEFSAAFFRLGHSMLTTTLDRLEEDGSPIPEGPLSLLDAFFNPPALIQDGGLEPVLRGLASQRMQDVDTKMVDDVRNFLFGPPGAGGLDLASLNIQRGRDHGLPDFNTLREALGLNPYPDFSGVTSDPGLAQTLEDLYGSVDNLDPWVGALAEDHLPGASLGETLVTMLGFQFESLRMGDRFWCERDPELSPQKMTEILHTRLSDIIRRNTAIENIQDDVFFVP